MLGLTVLSLLSYCGFLLFEKWTKSKLIPWHKCLVGLSNLRFWNFLTFFIYPFLFVICIQLYSTFSELPILEYVNPAIYLANICKNNPSIRMRCIMSHYVRASISYYEYQVKFCVLKSNTMYKEKLSISSHLFPSGSQNVEIN